MLDVIDVIEMHAATIRHWTHEAARLVGEIEAGELTINGSASQIYELLSHVDGAALQIDAVMQELR